MTSITGIPRGYTILRSFKRRFTVSGTAPGVADGGRVEVRCYYTDNKRQNAWFTVQRRAPVRNGRWSATRHLSHLDGGACRIVAVPENRYYVPLNQLPASQYGRSRVITVGYAFKTSATQFAVTEVTAHADDMIAGSADAAISSRTTTPAPRLGKRRLWNGVLVIGQGDPEDGHPYAGTNIDGHAGYADQFAPSNKLSRGEFTYRVKQNRDNGRAVLHESDPFYFCVNHGTVDDASTDCHAARYSGVTLHRTIRTTVGGRVLAVRDRFASGDGSPHQLSVRYDSEFGDFETVGIKSPGQGSYQPMAPQPLDTSSWPASSRVLLRDNYPHHPSLNNPIGALELSRRPDTASQQQGNTLTLRYDERVTKRGAAVIEQTLVQATSSSMLHRLLRRDG